MRARSHLALAALVLLTAAIHLVTVVTGTQFYLTQLTMAAYYGLVVIGLGVLMGYAGQISIGHAGFFAIGGYLAAALTTRNLSGLEQVLPLAALESLGLLHRGQDLYGEVLVTVAPWAAALGAVSAAALVALAIGIPVLKLKGHYLAMATWASAPSSTGCSWPRPTSARRTASPRCRHSPWCRRSAPWGRWWSAAARRSG